MYPRQIECKNTKPVFSGNKTDAGMRIISKRTPEILRRSPLMPILLLYSMSGLIIAAIVPVTKSMISIETISARAYKTKPSSVCTTLLRKLKNSICIQPPIPYAQHLLPALPKWHLQSYSAFLVTLAHAYAY